MTVRLTRTFAQVMVPVPTSGQEIRLTRTFAQVMTPVPTSGQEIRLTRTFAQVMTPVFTGLVFAEDDLALSESHTMVSNYELVSESLGVTDLVVDTGPYYRSDTDTFTLSESNVVAGPWPVDAADSITFSDSAYTTGPHPVDATDSITFSDETSVVGGAADVAATDSISFSDEATVEGGSRDVSTSDKLGHPFYGLTDEAIGTGGELDVTISDSLGLSETIVAVGGEQLATASDTFGSFPEYSFTDEVTVVGGARDVSASDSLGLSEVVVDGGDVRLFTTDDSFLDETVVDGGDMRKFASESVGLSETVIDIECVDDTLGLTDEAAAKEDTVGEDTFLLTDEATAEIQINGSVTESLGLTESFTTIWEWNTVTTDDLTVTEEEYIVGDPGYFQDVDVGLRDEATSGGNINTTANDILSLFEMANGWVIPAAGAVETATDTLSFSESARASSENRAKDTFTLTDEATATISRGSVDSLGFTDTASVIVDYNVTTGDTFVISESLMDVLSQNTCDYDESQAGAYPADTGLEFRLVGVGSWNVKAPSFSNKDAFSPHRTVNESRGGTLVITSQPEWPEVEVLTMDFSVLKKQEGLDLQDFLSDNLGKTITLTDWEGRAWTGIVTDTNTPLTEVGTDNFSIGFEFEGTKV